MRGYLLPKGYKKGVIYYEICLNEGGWSLLEWDVLENNSDQ
jgi:hypothetical protein